MQLFPIEMRKFEREASMEEITSQVLQILILSYMFSSQTEMCNRQLDATFKSGPGERSELNTKILSKRSCQAESSV